MKNLTDSLYVCSSALDYATPVISFTDHQTTYTVSFGLHRNDKLSLFKIGRIFEWTCDCPHFQYNLHEKGEYCKHIHAVQKGLIGKKLCGWSELSGEKPLIGNRNYLNDLESYKEELQKWLTNPQVGSIPQLPQLPNNDTLELVCPKCGLPVVRVELSVKVGDSGNSTVQAS